MKKLLSTLSCAAFLSLTGMSAALADNPTNSDQDQAFFSSLEGMWTGPGEVVAGKYKGTKFVCNFAGLPESTNVGMALDGSCRVGVFSQPMRATVTRSASGFSGAFNDGAKGEGIDIISGKVGSDHMVFALNRKKLDGAMMARLTAKDKLNVTLSVKVKDELIPVVGMTLKRTSHQVPRDFARK